MRAVRGLATVTALAVAGLAAVGCDVKSFIDPTEMFPNVKAPLQKPILTSLSALDPSIDDPEDEFYNAQEIQPQDMQVVSRDYRLGKGDLVNVAITGLNEPNLDTTKQTTVSESGTVNLPLIVTPVKAEGLTEPELQRAVSDAYRNANILSNAQVSVQVVEARARSFSILGAVNAPSQYIILKSDFRVLDALVLAHDTLPSVDTVYILRQVKEDPNSLPPDTSPPPAGGGATPSMTPPASGPPPVPPTPGVDPLAPRGDAGPAAGAPVYLMQSTPAMTPATPTTAPDMPATPPAAVPPAPMAPAPAAPAPMAPAPMAPPPAPAPVPVAPPGPMPSPPVTPPAASNFQFAPPAAPVTQRWIRVPLTALRAGDLSQNIVIRPGDFIQVPQPVVGEYYMGGHFARVGVYSLSARKITLKQAVISAGMLDGLAIPQRTEIYRRVGVAREALVRIDIDAIFSGDQPDIYLKPNDVIMEGTNLLAPFISAVRQGFRITYGFGFLYDQNYAPAQNGI